MRVLNHQIPDRVPIVDSIWSATVQRWHKEGLPEDTSPAKYFGYEFEYFGADLTPRFPVKILEENEEYVITSTPHGGKRKNHKDFSTTPEIIDCPIKTKDDWKEIKKRMAPDFTRINWASDLAQNKTSCEEEKFVCFSAACGYDALQAYMRSEQLLMAMAEDPEWVKDMVTTLAELIIITAELMLNNGFKFDAAFLYNDMGYKNGLLFSPDTYKKTHYDADRLLYAYFHSKGMKTILHSCGNVSELIPIMIETGLDCLQPLEVKAGMDVIKLKDKHGDSIAFMGNIDARLMSDADPSKIEEEIKKKFEAAKKDGGYIYHSDHSVPKNVSFQQYCRIMELVKKYGAYPEYEEMQKQAAEPQAPEHIKTVEKQPSAQTAVPVPEQTPKKRGIFGKKTRGEAPTPAKPKPQPMPPKPAKLVKPQKPEQPAGEGKKKGFKLPFGKKKLRNTES